MAGPLAYTVTISDVPTKIIDAGGGRRRVPQASFRCDGADIRWGGADLTWAEGYPMAAGGDRTVSIQQDRDIYACVEAGTAVVNVVREDGMRGDV